MRETSPYQGDHYRPGDYYRICDVCGFKYRKSETRKRWDGAWVCAADWEPRHPQEFLRGRADKINAEDPRPDVYSPLVTNGDFETGDTTGWENWNGPIGTNSRAVNANYPIFGNYSVEIIADGTLPFFGFVQNFVGSTALTQLATYNIDFYIYIESISAGKVFLDFFDNTNGVIIDASAESTTVGLQHLSVNVVIPSGCLSCGAYIGAGGSFVGKAYIDNFSMRKMITQDDL